MGNTGLTKRELNNFRTDVRNASKSKSVEKSLEHIIVEAIKKFYNNNKNKKNEPFYKIKVKFTHKPDGIIHVVENRFSFKDKNREALILLETKREMTFTKKEEQAKAIAQAIYYLKNFEKSGDVIPQVIIIADLKKIFAVPSSLVIKYLKKPYDWDIAPSSAWNKNTELYTALCKDNNLVFFIYDMLRSDFDFNEFMEFVDAIAFGEEPIKIKVTKETLLKAFEDFIRIVFGGHAPDENMWQMSLFIQSLLGNPDVYLHPNKPNTIVVQDKEYRDNFDTTQYQLFFSKYDKNNYTLAEQKQITEIADTLIKEAKRRYTGDFWTPKIWVDKAHELIEKQLGDDWKEKYIVWDASCGTKNLTRDYKFAQLYNSTLHQEELDISINYNPEAKATFQYDFLNNDIHLHAPSLLTNGIPTKMPRELYDALKAKKPIVFFMNPPYGQAGNHDQKNKAGMSITQISNLMCGYSQAKNELYCQFIYRVQLLSETFEYKENLHFFFFNKAFLTSPEYARFTQDLCSQFQFKKGFMFNADEFNGTSSAWAVTFSHWQIGGKKQKEFKFNVLQSNNNRIIKLCDWNGKLVPSRDLTIGSYARSNLELKQEIENIPVGGFNISKSAPKTKTKTAFGWFQDHGNMLQKANRNTSLSTGGCGNGGCFVQPDNFERVSIAFSVRKAMLAKIAEQKLLWVRDKDVFRKPSDTFEKSEKFTEFTADSVVYSLFASNSNQTSLRNFKYNGKKYSVNNEFFWLPKKHIEKLAQKYKNREIEQDASTDTERFVYKWLQANKDKLSAEANALLEIATHILDKSFQFRYNYNYALNKDKYNLQSWDAGWLQIYKMIASQDADKEAKKILQSDYEDFKKTLRILGEKIVVAAEKDEII